MVPAADEYGRQVKERFAALSERVAAACRRAGRDGTGVRIVAVTKYIGPERLAALWEAGVRRAGENRWQAAAPKVALGPPFEWHFIGPLQRNKARAVARHFAWVHSVDRAELARDLARCAREAGAEIAALVQVNISGEPQKGGVSTEGARALAELCAELPGLRPAGLMAIGSRDAGERLIRGEFAALRELRDRLRTQTGLPLPELSMGMSGDFEWAVAEGATLLRIGRALVL